MKTIEFNYEIAKANPERVYYRNGEKPVDVFFPKELFYTNYSIISIFKNNIRSHTIDGLNWADGRASGYDLVLKAETKIIKCKCWVYYDKLTDKVYLSDNALNYELLGVTEKEYEVEL